MLRDQKIPPGCTVAEHDRRKHGQKTDAADPTEPKQQRF